MIDLLGGNAILDFYAARHHGTAYLAIRNGQYVHLTKNDVTDGSALSYNYVTTDDGEAQILLTMDTIRDNDWYPLLDDDGNPQPDVAAQMADSINEDAGIVLAMAIDRARELAEAADRNAATAQASALARAAGVARVVNLCGGNQSEAARRMGLDQSTVNKLVRKAAAIGEAVEQGRQKVADELALADIVNVFGADASENVTMSSPWDALDK